MTITILIDDVIWRSSIFPRIRCHRYLRNNRIPFFFPANLMNNVSRMTSERFKSKSGQISVLSVPFGNFFFFYNNRFQRNIFIVEYFSFRRTWYCFFTVKMWIREILHWQISNHRQANVIYINWRKSWIPIEIKLPLILIVVFELRMQYVGQDLLIISRG